MGFVDPNATSNPTTGVAAPAAWGDVVRDDLMAIYGRPRVRAHRTLAQAISDSSATEVLFDAELTDSHSMHDNITNQGRLTIPSGWDGFWLVGASVGWEANVTGLRYAAISINSAIYIAEDERGPVAGSGECVHNLSMGWYASAGDYFTLEVTQTSGGSLQLPAAGYLPAFWAVQLTGTNAG